MLLTYSGECVMAHAFNSHARVVNVHALNPHCIPQIMLATLKVRKYFWVIFTCHWSSRSYHPSNFGGVTRKLFTIFSLGFLDCSFRVTHLTVSCGAVPVSFNWSWLSSQLQLLFENYGWQCILHLIKSRCHELVLSRVALRMFCSCLITQLILLLLLASVHKAMRRVWM